MEVAEMEVGEKKGVNLFPREGKSSENQQIRQLKRPQEEKVPPHNSININNTHRIIVLALGSSSMYAIGTRRTAIHSCCNNGMRVKKGNTRKRKHDKCINVENDNHVARVVISPYFRQKKDTIMGKKKDNERKNGVPKAKRSEGRRENVGGCYDEESGAGDAVSAAIAGVSPCIGKCGNNGFLDNAHPKKRKMEESSVLGTRENDGNYKGVVIDMMDKHDEKHAFLEKKREAKIFDNAMNGDEKRVVMQYYVKSDGKEKKEKKRRKKKVENDQSFHDIEIEAFHDKLAKVVSPYFIKKGTHHHGNSKCEYMEKKGNKRKRKDGNCINVGNDSHAAQVVSPYFRQNQEEQVEDNIMGKRKDYDYERNRMVPQGKRREVNIGGCYEAENGAGDAELSEIAGVSPYLCRCPRDKFFKEAHWTRRKVEEKSVLEKKANDRNCDWVEKNEQHVGNMFSAKMALLDLQRKADGPEMMVKHEEKLLKEKKREREIPASAVSGDGKIIVSPFLDKSDSKEKKKKRKMKKKVENDQSYGIIEMEPPTAELPKLVSPYFLKKGACDHGNSKFECMEKKAQRKEGKHRTCKKRTCDSDKETEKKVKKQRTTKKKRKLDEVCCMEENDENKISVLGPQSVVSAHLRTKVENVAKHGRGKKKVTITSAVPGGQDVINQGDNTVEIDVEDGSGENDTRNNCANYGEFNKASSSCFTNVKRKQVKPPMSLAQSDIDKNQDDLTLHADQERSVSSVKRKSETKEKKTTSSQKSHLAVGQEDSNPSSMRSREEDCIHENQNYHQASAAKDFSPYFQKVLVKDECGDERVESDTKYHNKKTVHRTYVEFEKLLSKYAYKCDSKMERNVDNGVKDEADNSVGKCEKRDKQQRRIANRDLSAAEKLSEAYQRKAPDNTWRPPRSVYNLLQEDHVHDPWRVLVICMLLNITTGPQVKEVLWLFFQLCPNAEVAIATDVIEIARVIQSLGLQRKRAAMIQRFSREYLSDNWTHVTQLHGIGKYAADAYAIFCTGMWRQVTPNDHMLKHYWKFLHNRGLKEVNMEAFKRS